MDWTRDRHLTLSGPPALIRPALVFLVITAVITVIRAAVDFDGGIWLVAFLLLVGFVAPVLLAIGQSRLRPEGTDPRRVIAEAVSWNVGALLVALGAMVDGKLLVLVGSLSLLLALVWFADSVLNASSGEQPAWTLYWALLLFLGVSVITGIGLSWSKPWL